MKKIISIFLIICLSVITILPVTAVNETVTEYIVGDADLDGRISIKDATITQKHIANILVLSEQQIYLADVDNNNNLNVKDATMIQKKLAGIIKEFPARNEDETITNPPTEPTILSPYEYLTEWVKYNGENDGNNITYVIQEYDSQIYTISYSPEYDNLLIDFYMNAGSSTESYAMIQLDSYFYGFSFYGDSIYGYIYPSIYSPSLQLTYSNASCTTFTPDRMLPLAKTSVDLLIESLKYFLLINELPITIADLGFISYDSLDSDYDNDYDYKDKCIAIGCDNIANNLSFYCSNHACAKNGCTFEKTYSSKFCSMHTCDSIGCNNGSNNQGNYCSEHACTDSNCFREKTYSGTYCTWHECNSIGCENKKKESGSYCSAHECAYPYCSAEKSLFSDYCYIHDN